MFSVKVSVMLFFLFAAVAGKSLACMCAGSPDMVRNFHQADAIFSGTITSISSAGSDQQLKIEFSIEQDFKGINSSTEVAVYTHEDEGACGYPFKLHSSYIVFANIPGRDSVLSRAGALNASLCSGTVSIDGSRLNHKASAESLVSLLSGFKDNPPLIPVTPCGELNCNISNTGLKQGEQLLSAAQTDPMAAFNRASDIDDTCTRNLTRRNIAEVWSQSDPAALFERLDGDFDRYLLCSYESDIISELHALPPKVAITWLEANTDSSFFPNIDPFTGLEKQPQLANSPKRVPFTSHFARWLDNDFEQAIAWYELNSEKIYPDVLLSTVVFDKKPALFFSTFESLAEKDQVRLVIEMVKDYELYLDRSSSAFVSAIEETWLSEWGKLAADSINGVVSPDILLDRTATYFRLAEVNGRYGNVSNEVYDVIQYLSWETVPAAVRQWVDKTPHLTAFVRSDIHAMLDSRRQ